MSDAPAKTATDDLIKDREQRRRVAEGDWRWTLSVVLLETTHTVLLDDIPEAGIFFYTLVQV